MSPNVPYRKRKGVGRVNKKIEEYTTEETSETYNEVRGQRKTFKKHKMNQQETTA